MNRSELRKDFWRRKKKKKIVLLEAPYRKDIPRPSDKHTVLLTIDLTRAVAAEAIVKKAVAIVSYREFSLGDNFVSFLPPNRF